MSIKVKRSMLMAALALGTLWDILCLCGMFRRKWMVSLAIVSIGSLCTLIPLMFQSLRPNGGKSKYAAETETTKKVGAGLTVCLWFAWAVTLIVCLVYPI